MKIPVSPTDRELIKYLGSDALPSSLPEECGADLLLVTNEMSIGIQRKEIPHDFLISVQDGRLAKETTLLSERCNVGIVLGEGRFRFYPDGGVATGAPRGIHNKVYRRFTRDSIQKLIMEICMIKGCFFMQTEDTMDTIRFIRTAIDFINDPTHAGLSRRPKAKGSWGAPSMKEEQMWLLQGFPGVGPGLAQSIYDEFGGIPLMWRCTYSQLMHVPKIGESRARKLWEMLPPITTKAKTE